MDRMLERINRADRFEELRRVREEIHGKFLRDLPFVHSFEWNAQLNDIHDALIRRIVALSEKMVFNLGQGDVPLPYAFVLFGSGGRQEQTLWSDQDNGLIYADPEKEDAEQAGAYFQALAECIEQGMAEAGYPPCEGMVICSNPQWRKPVGQFLSMVREWFDEPVWGHVRYLLMMADMRCVYGHSVLADRIKDEILEYTAAHPEMLHHMLQNTLHHKIPLGVFGQLIKERYGEDAGGVDIKYGAYLPIVNGVRLLSVEAGLRSTSTRERIGQLIAGGQVEEEIGLDWLEAFALALKLRSETPYQLKDGKYTTRGKMPADRLTRERINQLKFCLRIGKDLQKYVGHKRWGTQ
jgi:CBS domain-containing protein